MSLQLENVIYSWDDIGVTSSNFYNSIVYGPSSNNLVSSYSTPSQIVRVFPVSIPEKIVYTPSSNIVDLVLGNTGIVEYWSDPTLGSNQIDTEIKTSQGISLIITIQDCSGIYSTDPFTWNNNINGVEVDINNRPDMRFTPGGDYNIYNVNKLGSQIGYWAEGHDINVTLIHDNVNILHPDSKTIKSCIWHYDTTGFFNLYLRLKLDLSNVRSEYPFSHPDFYLSGCVRLAMVHGRYSRGIV